MARDIDKTYTTETGNKKDDALNLIFLIFIKTIAQRQESQKK